MKLRVSITNTYVHSLSVESSRASLTNSSATPRVEMHRKNNIRNGRQQPKSDTGPVWTDFYNFKTSSPTTGIPGAMMDSSACVLVVVRTIWKKHWYN